MSTLTESRVVYKKGDFIMTELPDKTRLISRVSELEDEEEEERGPKPAKWRRSFVVELASRLLKKHGVEDAIIIAPASNSQYNHHSMSEWSEKEGSWLVKLGMNCTMYTKKVKPKVAESLLPWFTTNYPQVEFLHYMMYSVVCEAIAPVITYTARHNLREKRRQEAEKMRELMEKMGDNTPVKEIEFAITREPLRPERFSVGMWLQNERQVALVKTAIIKHPAHVGILLQMLGKESEPVKHCRIDGICEKCGKAVQVTAPNKETVEYRFPKTCWARKCDGHVKRTSGVYTVRVSASGNKPSVGRKQARKKQTQGR
jgi:hypothetical protein